MAETIGQKLKNEAAAFIIAPVFPFMQKDWFLKMWLFIALSYVPVINVIIARGWRMEYIHRLGWRFDKVLPATKDVLTFLFNGLLLWIARGFFMLLIPAIIIMISGQGGWIDFWNDVKQLFELAVDFFWNRTLTMNQYFNQVWNFSRNELWASFYVFLIENVYLLVYVPMYRIGMIRFALTNKFFQSHFAVVKNFIFFARNFLDIVLMYTFNVFNFLLVLVVDAILAFTVIGVPLIPIVTFYMSYWNTGYEYGLLARTMVEQEGMVNPRPTR